MRRALIGSLMLLALLQRPMPCRAGWAEQIVAKIVMGSAKYILTYHPVIVASIVIFIFRHELMHVVGDNVTFLIGEYPVISFILGLGVLKVVIDAMQHSTIASP